MLHAGEDRQEEAKLFPSRVSRQWRAMVGPSTAILLHGWQTTCNTASTRLDATPALPGERVSLHATRPCPAKGMNRPPAFHWRQRQLRRAASTNVNAFHQPKSRQCAMTQVVQPSMADVYPPMRMNCTKRREGGRAARVKSNMRQAKTNNFANPQFVM